MDTQITRSNPDAMNKARMKTYFLIGFGALQ